VILLAGCIRDELAGPDRSFGFDLVSYSVVEVVISHVQAAFWSGGGGVSLGRRTEGRRGRGEINHATWQIDPSAGPFPQVNRVGVDRRCKIELHRRRSEGGITSNPHCPRALIDRSRSIIVITTPFSHLRNYIQHPDEVGEVKFLVVGDDVGARTGNDGVRGTSSIFSAAAFVSSQSGG